MKLGFQLAFEKASVDICFIMLFTSFLNEVLTLKDQTVEAQ